MAKEHRNVAVLIRLSPEHKAQFEAIAAAQVRTPTNLAKKVIQDFIRANSADIPKPNGAEHKAPAASKARVPA